MNLKNCSKICSRDELIERRTKWRDTKQKVGFTSGVFDLIHAGHVDYLSRAKAECDILILALNSDRSVRENKGPTRPICEEQFRAMVVSALSTVDFVFIFSEANNNQNIELLQPDVYFKAGDYTKDKLTSAPLVESYGGQVMILPFLPGLSSTTLIERMVHDRQSKQLGESLPLPKAKRRAPAIFLDRDGTINEHIEYLHDPKQFRLLPGVAEGLKRLYDAGYYLVIVTNQPGIGMGYFSEEDFYRVSKEFLRQVSLHGVLIDKIYFSPYSKAEESICRKPKTGMIVRATQELPIDLAESVVVGDTSTDIQLAAHAGIRSVLVSTGLGGKDGLYDAEPTVRVKDFSDAVDWIVDNVQIPNSETGEDSVDVLLQGESDLEKLQALGALASKVGHDFNNLLGTIQGCIDLVESRVRKLSPDKNPIEKQLSLMRAALKKSVQFTSKLRGFVRPDPLNVSRTTLGACVRSVTTLFEESGDLPCEFELRIVEDPEVEIGEYFVTQVISNLCNNAIEAMKDQLDRVLVFHVERIQLDESDARAMGVASGSFARLSVVDHGVGMNEETKRNLFRPFFSTKPKGIGEGLGLSLAMAQAVLQQHRGFMVASSEPKIGTVVHLYFPVAP